MDHNTKMIEDFLNAIKEVEVELIKMSFVSRSFLQKGYVYFIQYERRGSIIEFIFGPPEFQIDLEVNTVKGKFAFSDLVQIPEIMKWIDNHRYVSKNGRNISDELHWGLRLLQFSLPIIE